MQWVEAGLLSEPQADAIQSFENQRKSGRFGRGLVGLATFAILAGILSIIASNWHDIPGGVKIAAHVLLNLGIGYGAFRALRNGNTLWREGLTLAFFGLALTLIVLIGQVLQLEGNVANALLLWMIATFPFMWIFSQSWMTALPWTLAFLTSIAFLTDEYAGNLPDEWQQVYYVGVSALLPLGLFADGSLAFMKRLKPAWADVFLRTGAVLLAIGASLAPLMFYIGYDGHIGEEFLAARAYILLTFAAGFAGIFLHAALHNLYRDDERGRLGLWFAGVSIGLQALPFVLLGFESALFSALLFIGYWVFLGWLGQRLDLMRLVSLAIFLIAIRIFIIFCEVFGTLMLTGIGLIVGGLVMLGLLWAARKLNARLTQKPEGAT